MKGFTSRQEDFRQNARLGNESRVQHHFYASSSYNVIRKFKLRLQMSVGGITYQGLTTEFD